MAGERRPPRLVAAACCRRRHSCRGRRNWHRCRLHRPRSLPSRALAAMAEPTLNAATAAAHPSATAACCLRCRHRPVRISDLPLAATQGPRWALFTSRHRVCSDNQSVLRHASHCPPCHCGRPCDGPWSCRLAFAGRRSRRVNVTELVALGVKRRRQKVCVASNPYNTYAKYHECACHLTP